MKQDAQLTAEISIKLLHLSHSSFFGFGLSKDAERSAGDGADERCFKLGRNIDEDEEETGRSRWDECSRSMKLVYFVEGPVAGNIEIVLPRARRSDLAAEGLKP
jgi:hypothetical protein